MNTGYSVIQRDCHLTNAMDAAAPDGTPPRRLKELKNAETFLPAVPRRGPEAGVNRIQFDFHHSGANG